MREKRERERGAEKKRDTQKRSGKVMTVRA